MVCLKLFVEIMLQYINQEIDNSHFCDSRMCCSMYGCFCTLLWENSRRNIRTTGKRYMYSRPLKVFGW